MFNFIRVNSNQSFHPMKISLITATLLIWTGFITAQQSIVTPFPDSPYLTAHQQNTSDEAAKYYWERGNNETILDSAITYYFTTNIDSAKILKSEYFRNETQLTEFEYTFDEENNEWDKSRKKESFYDENDFLTLYQAYLWDSGQNDWINDKLTEFTYTGDGQTETIKSWKWEDELNRWNKKAYDSMTYNTNGDLLLRVHNKGNDDNEWEPSSKTEYIYRTDGLLDTVISSLWDAGWHYYGKQEHIYNNNLLETKFSYLWDDDGWNLNSKREYTYDEQDNLILKYVYLYIDDNWHNISKTTYEYDEDGHNTLLISYDWNNDENDWVYSYKSEYSSFTEEGFNLISAFYNWNSNTEEWVGTTKLENILNEEGELILVIFYRWDEADPVWVFDTKEFLYRSNITGTQEPKTSGIVLYPNPCHDQLTISKSKTENINCTLLNSKGQIIKIIALSKSNTILDLCLLPGGTYFLHYTLNGRNVTEKIIKR